MLTLQYMPYTEIEGLATQKKIEKLLDVVKEEKVVLLEGRLHKQEEAELIRTTMEEIDDRFKGIELSVIEQEKKNMALLSRLKTNLANLLLGNRQGLTIIGPATIIQEIKKDPDKIQLFTTIGSKKKR